MSDLPRGAVRGSGSVRTVCPEVSRTAGRVRARHAFLMSQLPAHLGYPKEAIQTLDGKGAAHKRVLLSSP